MLKRKGVIAVMAMMVRDEEDGRWLLEYDADTFQVISYDGKVCFGGPVSRMVETLRAVGIRKVTVDLCYLRMIH